MTTNTPAPLHIVGLQAENVKRIRAVTIHPDGRTVVLAGKNAQGKTSILDSIWLALGGGAGTKGTSTSSPIRDGEDSARVELDLGELKVVRTWTRAGDDTKTTIAVTSADGKLGSPQQILDKLMGAAGFDPLAFTRMSDRAQVAALAGVVDLPFDPDEYDTATKAIFDKRTDVNRDVRSQKAQVEGLPAYPDAQRVDVAEVMAKLQEAQQHNRAIDDAQGTFERADDELERALDAVEHARKLAEEASTARNTAKDRLEALAPAVELDDLQQRIATASTANSQADAHERRVAAVAALHKVEDQAAELTRQIDARNAAKAEALAAVAMPVPGLGFEDGQVTYKGQPFRQASGAEQVHVSAAIAMAGEPRLRVVTIRDASLLDSDAMATITALAEARDFQVWLEVVDETGAAGILIEDGATA